MVECGRHLNIELLTLTEVAGVSGEQGDFTVELVERPRYVDMDKCIACGECARKCPKKVPDEYQEGAVTRKAIYVKYAQAVPLKYQIDEDNCIYLQKGKCGACAKVCPAGAINFKDGVKTRRIQVGSMVLAPGFKPFDPSGIRTWGYDTFPNVITAMEMERYLSASGPSEGHLVRPSDGREAKKVAWLQCVGSRDLNKCDHGYCSSVCCMYAVKQAMLARDHVPGLNASIFFMDMRTMGKDFERYYDRARAQGINFRRCRVHSLEPGQEDRIYLRYITDEGKQVADEFDLVVLSTGLETPPEAIKLAETCGVELNHYNFADCPSINPVATNRPGVFACGAYVGPKDIPMSVMQASAAAAAAAIPLASARGSLTTEKTFPPERDVRGKEPRIGVFVCHCGSNIAGVIDVEDLAAYAERLPHVAYVQRNLFTCSQDTQEVLKKAIADKGLNRIVVAACTPRTHEPLFRETMKAAGLNENLFEMANIRNQASWVHAGEPAAATVKAKDLVRMAVAKVGLLSPQPPLSVGVNQHALVVGGGVSGMSAALGLADQGFQVDMVERSGQLGGNALHLFKTWKNEPIQAMVDQLVARVGKSRGITVHLNSRVARADGFVGNFTSVLDTPAGEVVVEHGVAIVAIGGRAYQPDEYGYGTSRRVFTALEFDKLHLLEDGRIKNGKNFVFIQCVGSREPARPYCSRVCCTHAVQAAIALKREDASRNVYILYRDIRTYGQREDLYRRARELGVIFINYDMHGKPTVRMRDDERLDVTVWDHVLHQPFGLTADVVALATAIVPSPEAAKLAGVYKLPLDTDGFLQEAHAKLRPVDFAADGLFLAGLAHYPKPIEESIAQAQAAVGRAVTVLAKTRIDLDAVKAQVFDACDGCAVCLDVCPFDAISLVETEGGEHARKVEVNAAKCKGCGCCMASCPKEGIGVAGYTFEQLSAQIAAALA